MGINRLRTKLYADGADIAAMVELARDPRIQGFTTNPTLMRQAGVTDYERFAREVIALVPDRPISLEVFADDFGEMERQARIIAGWGGNVYVKIPVANTRRESSAGLVRRLSQAGVKVNVTALLALDQVAEAADALGGGAPSYVSVFAGRVADTGRDPVPLMSAAVQIVNRFPGMELIWASTRSVLDIVRAGEVGCHIVTVTTGILQKLPLLGRDLHEYSQETVQMFYDDACKSGFQL
jgi:transaldolase